LLLLFTRYGTAWFATIDGGKGMRSLAPANPVDTQRKADKEYWIKHPGNDDSYHRGIGLAETFTDDP